MAVNEDRATSRCGACWRRRSLPETICGTCPRKPWQFLPTRKSLPWIRTALGVEGFKYSGNATNAANDGVEVWFKPLSNDAWAMCFLNRGTNAANPSTFNWKNETVTDDLSKRAARFDTTTYKIRDFVGKKRSGNHG